MFGIFPRRRTKAARQSLKSSVSRHTTPEMESLENRLLLSASVSGKQFDVRIKNGHPVIDTTFHDSALNAAGNVTVFENGQRVVRRHWERRGSC